MGQLLNKPSISHQCGSMPISDSDDCCIRKYYTLILDSTQWTGTYFINTHAPLVEAAQ